MRIRFRWLALLGVIACLGVCGREVYRVVRIARPAAEAEAPAPKRDPASQRRIEQGEVVGFRSAQGAHVYRTLPFAAPPVGLLRWTAPRPPAAFAGVREALAAPPKCVQPKPREGAPGVADTDGQEDCLYLDVYAPAMSADQAAGERLPVMVWIHGGANITGGAAQTDASRLAVEQQVVVVVPNYRLGAFGWFSHPALAGADASAEDRSGNYGTLDLIQALRWVQRNVRSFGGDPERVTLFGVSAGAANALSLLLAPPARGLFHGAISQSAVLYSYSPQQAQAYTEEGGIVSSSAEILARLLVSQGRATDRAAAKTQVARMDAVQIADFLRSQTPEALINAMLVQRPSGDDRPPDFATVLRDGVVMPAEEPLQLFARGEFHQVPLLLGTNRDEMKSFMVGNPELVETGRMGVPNVKDGTLYALLAEYRSESWRAGTVHAIAPLLRKRGASVFAYRFDWDEEPRLLWNDLSLLLGAAHGLETPFVFGTFDPRGRTRFVFTEENRDAREALSSAIRSYWAEFAVHGAPGKGRKGDLPEWKPWSDDAKFIVLDTEADGGIRMERHAATIGRLLERLVKDARLPEPQDKCRVLYWLTHRGRHVEPSRYSDVPGLDCSRFPPERYPWAGAQAGGS